MCVTELAHAYVRADTTLEFGDQRSIASSRGIASQ